jgi:hypothetical protein
MKTTIQRHCKIGLYLIGEAKIEWNLSMIPYSVNQCDLFQLLWNNRVHIPDIILINCHSIAELLGQ